MPANTYGRQVVLALQNNSGAGVIAGDVVVVDTAHNDSFTTTTTGAFVGMVGVAQETIANLATGRVLVSGYAALVNVNASVTRGDFGKTYTVAKQATDAGATRVAGTFCQFLTGGTTPDAYVLSMPDGNAPTGVIWTAGTAMPASPVTNERITRTDLGLDFYYDGTRWLSTTLHNSPIAADGESAQPIAATGTPGRIPTWGGDFGIYVVKFICRTYVLTTNNGSNYWTILLLGQPSATSMGSFNTAADSAAAWTSHAVTVNTALASTDVELETSVGKVSGPGNLYLVAGVTYRVIGT